MATHITDNTAYRSEYQEEKRTLTDKLKIQTYRNMEYVQLTHRGINAKFNVYFFPLEVASKLPVSGRMLSHRSPNSAGGAFLEGTFSLQVSLVNTFSHRLYAITVFIYYLLPIPPAPRINNLVRETLLINPSQVFTTSPGP